MKRLLWMLGVGLALLLVGLQAVQGDGEGLLWALLRLVGWLS